MTLQMDALSQPISLSRLDGGYVYLGGGETGIEYYPDSKAAVAGRPAEVEFYPEGSFIKARRQSLHVVKSAAPPPPNPRGVVSGFSRQSRNRLLQKLAKLKRAELPLFVTLTYPGVFPVAPEDWKKHLDNFAKRFRRRFPNAGFIWKLEPQKRGAPHFHLLAWDSQFTPDQFCAALRAWIKHAWYEVVGSGDLRHERAGTDVQIIRSWSGVMFYASKYMGKPVDLENDAWGNPGRWWGVVGKENIPYAERLVAWLHNGDVNALLRWIRRFRNLEGRDCFSRWAIVTAPDKWVDNVARNHEARRVEDECRGLSNSNVLPGWDKYNGCVTYE